MRGVLLRGRRIFQIFQLSLLPRPYSIDADVDEYQNICFSDAGTLLTLLDAHHNAAIIH